MKLRTTVLSATLAVPMIFAGFGAIAETLNMYSTQSGSTMPAVVGVNKYAKELSEATDGELEIRVHLAGSLQINAADATSAVAANVVQMAEDLFFSGNVPVATVLRLPAVVGGISNMDAAMDASIDAVSEAYAAKGITVLSGYLSPPQYVWLTEEASGIDDVEGLKLRVSSPEQAEFVKSLGGVPIVLPPSEVSSALERGVVEGLLTSGLGGEFFGGPLKSALLVPVNFNNNYFIVNTSVYEGLSPEHRDILKRLAQENAKWIQTEFLGIDDGAIQRFRDRDDFNVIDPSEEDMAKAVAVSEPMWAAWVEEQGEEGQRILDAVRGSVSN